MRWLAYVGAVSLLFAVGCERIQRGEVKVAVQPEKEVPVKVKPSKAKPTQAEVPSPITSEPPAPQAAPQTAGAEAAPQQPSESKPTQPTIPQPPPATEVTTAQPTTPSMPSAAEVAGINFADEARSLRASADALHAQFERLPVAEIKSRLLLLNQAVSELEFRSPALVLWRTALRLEVTSKSPYPDVAVAKAWLSRARTILMEQKTGLTALANSESALKAGDWKAAITALRDAATRLKAVEQAEALTQARVCFLNALEAIERQKSSVAKAEVGEAVKALDRLISLLP